MMDSTSGVNRLQQTIVNQRLRRLVAVGAKTPRVATAPLLRKLGIPPIEAMAEGAIGLGRSLKRPPYKRSGAPTLSYAPKYLDVSDCALVGSFC
jgi:hypothetical protein